MNVLLLIPIFAVVLTNIIGLNIINSYWKNREKIIKKYNYLLFYLTFISSFCWFVYGILTNDIFVWLSVFSSLFGSLMFIQVLHKEINPKYLFWIELLCGIFYVYFMFVTLIISFISDNNILKIVKQIHYILSMAMSISVNFSPMLILYEVVKTKNTELIYLPQAFINLINLLMWLIYAISIEDIYQVITDVVGMIMCLIQIIVYVYYTCFYNHSQVQPVDNNILV